MSNLAVLALEGIGSVAEGGQGLLAWAQCQGNSLQGRHNNTRNRSACNKLEGQRKAEGQPGLLARTWYQTADRQTDGNSLQLALEGTSSEKRHLTSACCTTHLGSSLS